MKEKTILILGASSFVGSNLVEYLKNDFRVVGTYFSNPIKIPGVVTLQCDVLNRDAVQMVIFAFRPDITIYCIGLSSISDCADDDKLSHALNTMGVYNVSAFTERYKSKLCYISSGFVFPGLKKDLIEAHMPDPTTHYGRSKADAEFFIQKSNLNYIIFRCCQFYGRSINSQQITFFENLQRKIVKDERIVCDNNIFVGHLDVYYLAVIIKASIRRGVTNRLFHICSKDIMNYYEFSKLYSKVFSSNDSIIQRGKWPYTEKKNDLFDVVGEAEKYFNLSSANLENHLNMILPTIEESLKFTYLRYGGSLSSSGGSHHTTNIEYI